MSRDRTTPRFEVEGQRAVLSGSEFLTGQEAVLQARIDEIERELAGLAGTPDDVGAMEQQALDSLRVLADLLYPPATSAPVQPSVSQSSLPSPTRPSVPVIGHKRTRLIAGLLVAVAAVAIVFLLQGVPLLTGTSLAPTTTPTLSRQAAISGTPTAVVRSTQIRPESATTPLPSPTKFTPIVLESRNRRETVTEAEAVQILGISDTVRLDMPLTLMTETIELVDGVPVLRPVLPRRGAGVHRASVPFGETGVTVIAIPGTEATDGLWQVRPGDHLVGCNDDGTCHDYRVVAVESWPLDRVRRFVEAWPDDNGVWLYAIRETDAWVVQAQRQEEER